MKKARKCKECKSTNLTYHEDWEIRHWTWWQWVIAWVMVPVVSIVFLPMGIIYIIFLLYNMFKKKVKIYTYTCKDCGYESKV